MKRLVRVDVRVYEPGNDPATEDPRYVDDVRWLDVGEADDRQIALTASLQARAAVERILRIQTLVRDGGRA